MSRMVRAGVVLSMVLAACAPQRRVDPTAIDLPAAERLTSGQVMEIVDAVGRYHTRGYALLAERSGNAGVREMANDVLVAERTLAERRAAVETARRSHHLARSVLDREARLADALPPQADEVQTAAFIRILAEQERWFLILIDNSLARSATGSVAREHVAEARAHALENFSRLRGLRATLHRSSGAGTRNDFSSLPGDRS